MINIVILGSGVVILTFAWLSILFGLLELNGLLASP